MKNLTLLLSSVFVFCLISLMTSCSDGESSDVSEESTVQKELSDNTSDKVKEGEHIELFKDENGDLKNGNEQIYDSENILIKENQYKNGELVVVNHYEDDGYYLYSSDIYEKGRIIKKQDYDLGDGVTITYYDENGNISKTEETNNVED
jgi:hypothetical protein